MSSLTQIESYFPSKAIVRQGVGSCVKDILSKMKKADAIAYSGHASVESLREGLCAYIGKGSHQKYQPPSKERLDTIFSTIDATVLKCNNVLPVPTKNYVFIFPYFPTESDKVFNGVMAVARYSCVFHVFLADNFEIDDLERTIAHELNHTIYYYHHFDSFGSYTLLDQMVIEGLAEHFVEEVLDVSPAPWSKALTDDMAQSIFGEIEEQLHSTDEELHLSVMYGDERFAKWSGYSLGYKIVAGYRKQRPSVTWEDLMRIDSIEILKKSKFKKA